MVFEFVSISGTDSWLKPIGACPEPNGQGRALHVSGNLHHLRPLWSLPSSGTMSPGGRYLFILDAWGKSGVHVHECRKRPSGCKHGLLQVLTVWQIPEYFMSTRTSLPRTSSSTTVVSLKSSPGFATTKASVSIFVADMLLVVSSSLRSLQRRLFSKTSFTKRTQDI